MRRQGVKRFLYQAGGLTRRYKEKLPIVIEYLVEEAQDVDWIVHRAGIISDGSSKGILKRDRTKFSLATHVDIAKYNFQIINDDSAIHSYDLS
jgi:hypothetical protein